MCNLFQINIAKLIEYSPPRLVQKTFTKLYLIKNIKGDGETSKRILLAQYLPQPP